MMITLKKLAIELFNMESSKGRKKLKLNLVVR